MVSVQVRSTVNTNYIKSLILLQNTRCVQEMESWALFAHEKCIIFVILYVFVLTTTKTRHLKKHKNIKNKHKNVFLNFNKKHLKTFFTSMLEMTPFDRS